VSGGSAIVHLIGYPGVGKYTIAKELATIGLADGGRLVLVDNHHTANVIFAVMDIDGVRQLPDSVWDRVEEVRSALYRTIEELSPPDWGFVFTNVLINEQPRDRPVLERLAQLAARRGSCYVPVRLTCDRAELLRRVVRPEREARAKWRDAAGVAAYADASTLIDVSPHAPLDLDVTALTPEQAARSIRYHVTRRRSPAAQPRG